MNLCRLCGEEKSPLDLNIELCDKTSSNWIYRDLIEHHSRVSLNTSKLLPQSICEDCRGHVDSFAEFSTKLQAVQNNFDEEDHELEPQECFMQLQPIVELFPESFIKVQKSDDTNDDDDSETSNFLDSKSTDDNLCYDELFKTELSCTTVSKFQLHLDVPEKLEFEVGELSAPALTKLNPTRWSNLITNCEVCNVPISSLIEFNLHQEKNHKTKAVKVPCSLCSKSFKKSYSFINHILNKHFQLEHLRYCCLVCDAMFYGLVQLYLHTKNLHMNEVTPRIFQCLICGHHSESLSKLKKHKNIHDFDEETEEIHRIFTSMENTRSHELCLPVEDTFKNDDGTVATDHFKRWCDFSMKCSLCQKDNLSPIDYYMHHINEHTDWVAPGKYSPLFKFTCKDCLECFGSLTTFCFHLISKHRYVDLSYRCIVCSKMYWNYFAYSCHLRKFHPSFRLLLCMICGKMFDRFSLFRHHLTVVHESINRSLSLIKKRRKDVKNKVKVKREKLASDSESESENEESHSDLEEDSDENEIEWRIKNRSKRKCKEKKVEVPKRRPNNRHRPTKQNLYGSDLDSPEKLFAEEIRGASVLSCSLHLNIFLRTEIINGEVSDDLACSQGINPIRWRDLLICAVCKVRFNDINALTDHITINHGSRMRAFGCFNCDIEYGALYESSLVNHLVERHYYEHLKLCCLVCSKLFYDFSSLVNHYKTHNGRYEVLVCFICGFYAKTIDDLKEHKAYHMQMEKSKPENQILCEKVLDRFNKGNEPNTINTDISECERNPDGSVTIECQRRFTVDWSFAKYQCPLCFIENSTPFELFAHLRLKHPKDQEQTRKIYSCNTCVERKEFSGMHYFINHAAEFHFESLRFTCIVCSRLFWNYVAIANHYKNIHPSFTAVFCCHCGKLFHSITSGAIHYKKIMIMLTDEEKKLKREGKLETEESSHICHVCGKACKNNYTLIKHLSTHEEPDPSKMLQCHVCSKLFNTKNKLAQHMVGHNNLRKWKCKTCGMSFNFKKLLQMHTRAVHENERSFACSFCEKRFFKKYDLTVHVRLHTGDFPYHCPIPECDAKYPAWSNLFKHCQSRHKLDIRSEGYKKLRASEKTTPEDDFESD